LTGIIYTLISATTAFASPALPLVELATYDEAEAKTSRDAQNAPTQTIATAPSPVHSRPQLPDTTNYSSYSYVRFVGDLEDIPELTDEEFYDIAGRVIFPVNKWYLPKRDSLIMQLRDEVLPLINRDSLELAGMIIRGAASPEGPTRWNKFLGEHRAETLLKFLKEHINAPIDESTFNMEIDIEDYRTLCIMMHRASDKDYAVVQALCDMYLPKNNVQKLKYKLQTTRQGTLWRRLLRQYFPRLRAARVVFFFRSPISHTKDVGIDIHADIFRELQPPTVTLPASVPVERKVLYRPRRELLSVKRAGLRPLVPHPERGRRVLPEARTLHLRRIVRLPLVAALPRL